MRAFEIYQERRKGVCRTVKFYNTGIERNMIDVAQIRHAAVHRLLITDEVFREEMVPASLAVISCLYERFRNEKLIDIQRAFAVGTHYPHPEGTIHIARTNSTSGNRPQSTSGSSVATKDPWNE